MVYVSYKDNLQINKEPQRGAGNIVFIICYCTVTNAIWARVLAV